MLANRNLRFLVLGQFISAIGDHFYLIALPWLGLTLTGSALVAGTLLAIAGVPRSVFMLLGGAATDRFSAKKLLILSNGLQGVLMAVFGAVLLRPSMQLWFIYVLAFITGLIDAFGLPAFTSLLPHIVDPNDLESGNTFLQGANMVSGVIGPVLAGLLISLVTVRADSQATLGGLALAFLIDAATYFIGISFFWRIRTGDEPGPDEAPEIALIQSIHSLIAYIRSETQLKYLFLLMMVVGLFLSGTIRVGFPLLADTFLSGGARDYGFMNSAFGAGMLIGMISVNLLPKPPQAVSGLTVLSLFAFLPAGLILLGLTPPLGESLAIILVMGAGFGYVTIYLLSWLQRRTPTHLLGRIMAAVLFATTGLTPISQVLMSYLLDLDIQATLIGVGSLVLLLMILTGTKREMWSLEL